MIAMGAGFLILTPTALFVLHTQRIIDGYRAEVRNGGRLVPAFLGVAAIAAMPVVYTVQAIRDHRVLGRAIDYTYSPDYRASGFHGSPAAIGRALVSLREFKAGVQLPFLSDYYNWIVFDGLVLPDEKMAHLHRVFLGRDLLEPSRRIGDSFFSKGNLGRGQRGGLMEARRNTSPFPQEVKMEKPVVTTEAEDAATERTRITLTLKNTTGAVSEFATTLRVPEGVLVSGFWLYVGTERVPGRIFKKKTALWVYQKIRDVTRRDPGILLYTGPETLELRVFPFSAYATRTVEIELLRPSVTAASVQIGSETLALGSDAETPKIALSTGESGSTLTIPPRALTGLPAVSRRPYLHFIIDRSGDSTLEGAALRDALVSLARKFPEAQECVITAANFDAAEISDGFLQISALSNWDPQRIERLPKRGGFVQDRALKRALLFATDDLGTASSGAVSRFPLPIIVRSSNSQVVTEGELEEFGDLAPDLGGYFVSVGGGDPISHQWSTKGKPFESAHAPQPVSLFKVGSAVVPVVASDGRSSLIALPHGNGDLQIWDVASSAWRAAPCIQLAAESRYSRGAGAWLAQTALVQQPSLGKEVLRRLVALSRATGVIVPATSYIVVENSAQWRKLEESEKKKLANNAALDFEETPEPTTALLLACGGAILASRRRRRV